jgi:hypothetical protein
MKDGLNESSWGANGKLLTIKSHPLAKNVRHFDNDEMPGRANAGS